MIGFMTYARSILIPTGSDGTFHCVWHRVRRAFLSGEKSGVSQEALLRKNDDARSILKARNSDGKH